MQHAIFPAFRSVISFMRPPEPKDTASAATCCARHVMGVGEGTPPDIFSSLIQEKVEYLTSLIPAGLKTVIIVILV